MLRSGTPKSPWGHLPPAVDSSSVAQLVEKVLWATSSHRWALILKPHDLTRYMPMLIHEFTG